MATPVEWIMIVVLTVSSGSVTHIPGFDSKESCEQTAATMKRDSVALSGAVRQERLAGLCVERITKPQTPRPS